MTAKPAVDEIRLSRVQLLLALSVFVNYLDRGNLSIAAPLLKNEFQLSATQLGVLLSSFFWTYSFFLPVSGWLVDRLDVKWVIASGFFLWPEPGSNGMILDPDGRVSVAGHARRNVWRMKSLDPKAQITILADCYQGKKFNSPNDLVYKSDGSLYFTDPPYGLPTQEDNDPQKELSDQRRLSRSWSTAPEAWDRTGTRPRPG